MGNFISTTEEDEIDKTRDFLPLGTVTLFLCVKTGF